VFWGKIFNISADCKPSLHYMVNIEDRLNKIKEMTDQSDYFIINRARQYGKTTTLRALADFLKKDYRVISLDFQMMGASKFRNENIFSLTFANIFINAIKEAQDWNACGQAVSSLKTALQEHKNEIELLELFEYLSEICRCSEKPVVLLID